MDKRITASPPEIKTFIQQVLNSLAMAHDTIIESRIGQIRDLVYLSTKNLSMPKGQARKLIPKFIGPMVVVGQHAMSNMYMLDLPDQLKACRVHPMFHMGLLRAHEPNDDTMFPRRDAQAFYDISNDKDAEWVVDKLVTHRWKGAQIKFLVK